MELSKIDKDSILNPIIDEIGVISPSEKERIISTISTQLDRIIVEKFSGIISSLNESVKSVSSTLDTVLGNQKQSTHLFNRMESLESRFVEEISKLSYKVDEIKTEICKPPVFTTLEESVIVNKEIDPRKEFEDKKFSELIKIAKERNLGITPRMKKEDIITLLVKGD